MTISQKQLDEWRKAAEKATQGEWSAGCFKDPESECQCKYVFSQGHAGSIATVSVDNGKNIADGGNDCPTTEEARANLIHIANASPANFLALIDDLEAARKALKSLVHYELWMDDWGDDVEVKTFKRHTHGDLRQAAKQGEHND